MQPLARAVLRTQSDDRLVALARDGKEAAFEEIVRRYRPALVAFAAAYGPPDPEDVVQESLLRSWDALRESTGEMHLKAWLYTIVRNRSLNARRDARPHEQLTEEIDGVPQPPEIVLSNDELQRAVVAIGALPEPQREALVRSALEGHTHDQIAAAIGSTPGAVRQLIYRARTTVRHGVGAVIPLPLVAALVELGAGGGAGAAAGGAAGGAAAAGGTSLVAKTALVAAIGAVAIGSGAAIRNGGDSDKPAGEPRSAESRQADPSRSGQGPGAAGTPVTGDDPTSAGDDHGRARGEDGSEDSDDRSGHDGGDDDGSGSGSDDSAGPGGGEPEPGDDSRESDGEHEDDSPNSGPGSGSSGSGSSEPSESDDDSGYGSGDSGSGHTGSGSSGSGSDDDPIATVPEPDSSGSGDGDDDLLETTVPEPDHSGPGGGGLEPDDDA